MYHALLFAARDKGAPTMQNELLTVFTVAQILNRSPSTIRKYEGEGRLKAVRTSAGARLFRRADVERFMKHRERSEAEPQPAA
jgi:excisionase family DNA binding protein